MKLSQLKQIIKEEINELGFDYPGKPGDTPSPYQNGIMDALKAMQQLGVNIDVQAVMDIIYPDDDSTPPIVNEEFDNRRNAFYNIFLQTYYSMNKHKITFDEATDKLFTWIKANFK